MKKLDNKNDEMTLDEILGDSINGIEKESDVILMIPYLRDEFKNWLMTTRENKEKSAEDYLRTFESAYESLYEIVEIDLYSALRAFLTTIPGETSSNFTKELAPELVNIYLEAIQEELDKNEDSYSKADFRAIAAYHDFIVYLVQSNDPKALQEKSKALPDEVEFLNWLEKEYKMDLENAGKIVSSVKRMDLVLPSMVTDLMTFLDVLRVIPDKTKREKYFDMVSKKKGQVYAKSKIAYKTIQIGLSNIKYYINFLNQK